MGSHSLREAASVKEKILCFSCCLWVKKEMLRLFQVHIHLSQIASIKASDLRLPFPFHNPHQRSYLVFPSSSAPESDDYLSPIPSKIKIFPREGGVKPVIWPRVFQSMSCWVLASLETSPVIVLHLCQIRCSMKQSAYLPPLATLTPILLIWIGLALIHY